MHELTEKIDSFMQRKGAFHREDIDKEIKDWLENIAIEITKKAVCYKDIKTFREVLKLDERN